MALKYTCKTNTLEVNFLLRTTVHRTVLKKLKIFTEISKCKLISRADAILIKQLMFFGETTIKWALYHKERFTLLKKIFNIWIPVMIYLKKQKLAWRRISRPTQPRLWWKVLNNYLWPSATHCWRLWKWKKYIFRGALYMTTQLRAAVGLWGLLPHPEISPSPADL